MNARGISSFLIREYFGTSKQTLEWQGTASEFRTLRLMLNYPRSGITEQGTGGTSCSESGDDLRPARRPANQPSAPSMISALAILRALFYGRSAHTAGVIPSATGQSSYNFANLQWQVFLF
jgi:hypothetical protein